VYDIIKLQCCKTFIVRLPGSTQARQKG